jgi:hypothetical protein
LSDEDAVVLEVTTTNTRIIIASMYLDINRQIDIDMLKIEVLIIHAKGAGVLIAMDSSSRSPRGTTYSPTEEEECWRNL